MLVGCQSEDISIHQGLSTHLLTGWFILHKSPHEVGTVITHILQTWN